MIDALRQEALPEKLTPHQQDILNHLRGLAIHGNQYQRSALAIDILREIQPNSTEFEKNAFRILVRHRLISEDEPLELERAGYTSTFPKGVVSASKTIDPPTLISDPKRIDLTKIPTITIDEIGTYDRDDAISLHSDTAGISYLGIHVTDAGFLVPPYGAIDTEAKNRMSSIYLPTQILPMLPHSLVATSGTLSKGRKRAALSIIAKLSPTNTLIDWDIHRSVIESDEALSYEDAEFALEDPSHKWHRFIHNLDNISTELMSKREASGSVDIQRPDMAIDVEESDEITIRLSVKNRTRKIIAELMILYNTLMAEFCKSRSIPVIFRSQPPPATSSSTSDLEDGPYLWFMQMQHLPSAEFSTVPEAHHSLGVEHYSQVSAPLRRYTDLITQRQIGHYLDTGKFLYPVEEIASVGQRGSIQLREIAGIEDSVKRYWFLKFLAKKMCESENQKNSGDFYAVALEKSFKRGALLELSEYPFRFRATLPNTSNPGDTVLVKLRGIDLWHRSTHFTYVSTD
ncbi:MAG: ribonuclease catalytic domain-containing protein [Chloroflexota bacterium]|nr:ribonuclease catalytic domain-containing protein [Chloroflexota bacterium]